MGEAVYMGSEKQADKAALKVRSDLKPALVRHFHVY
jgi:hypothetical protein